MYHRVVAPEDLSYPIQPGMYVRPETFELHAEYLHKNCNVISIDDLAERIRDDRDIPPRTVAITFDDGWRDLYDTAAPILSRYGLPATAFLATSFIGSDRLFWTDEVASALERLWGDKKALLKQLASNGSQELSEILQLALPSLLNSRSFVDSLEFLISRLKTCTLNERRIIVSALMEHTANATRERHFLNWEEVSRLAAQGLSFGSHSHSHRYFSELPPDDARNEIEASWQMLEEHNITNTIRGFCYPGGQLNWSSQRALREQGVSYALAPIARSYLNFNPPVIGRVGVHEDIASTAALFTFRLWA